MKFILRATYWDAPTLHQFLMALAMLVLAAVPLFWGVDPQLHGLRLEWLFYPPACILSLIMAVAGIYTTIVEQPPGWCYKLRLVFVFYNVVYYTSIAAVFGTEFRVGSIINPIVMLWSIWLLLRVISDRRIQIEFIRRNKQ